MDDNVRSVVMTVPPRLNFTMPVYTQIMFGGAPTHASRIATDNVVTSKEHAALVAAVKASGLMDSLVNSLKRHRLT